MSLCAGGTTYVIFGGDGRYDLERVDPAAAIAYLRNLAGEPIQPVVEVANSEPVEAPESEPIELETCQEENYFSRLAKSWLERLKTDETFQAQVKANLKEIAVRLAIEPPSEQSEELSVANCIAVSAICKARDNI